MSAKATMVQTKAPPEDGSGEGRGTAAGALSHSLRNALRDEPTMGGLIKGPLWVSDGACFSLDQAAPPTAAVLSEAIS